MFGALGTFVHRMRFAVIAVLIAVMAGLGLYGLDLDKHLSQSGWFDPTSESAKGAQVADTALGRDHRSDAIVLITPPAGTKVDDPAFGARMENAVTDMLKQYPGIVQRSSDESDPVKALQDNHAVIDPFFLAGDNPASKAAQDTIRQHTFSKDREHAFISIGLAGNDDTTVLDNYKKIEPFLNNLGSRPGLTDAKFQLAGLQPVSGAMASGMDADIKRAEVIALPVVAVMLFFVFGGVVAACLPVLIGGLTIAGSLGIMKIIAQLTELNVFAQSVVTLIGLGIAIDYGLFIVSRFREELAEGYSTRAAVRRSVMTAGQTVVFSATIIVAALACLLMMPQGFLKSVSYGAIFSVGLAALLSVTVLPAILSILGPRIDALGLPFLRRTRTRSEVEHGFWGRLAGWVMRHPVATAIPTILLLLLLTAPFSGIKFGGISEKYLPPDNPSRVAQQQFDKYFPAERTEEIKLVLAYDPNNQDSSGAIEKVATEANKIPGFTKKFSTDSDNGALTGQYGDNGPEVIQMSAGLVNPDTAGEAIKKLRAIDHSGVTMWVTGTPALTQDSIDALLTRLPVMATLLVLVTGLLMFLAFGSVVLPIKAALMSALGLGATLGILTWVFVDGHGAGIANFTPGPLFAAVLVLIISIVFGLSTDYEVFLLSRMVEARQKGASTPEAIRVGTAHTGRIITAAAAILVVVTGAFGLSDIVMMKYIAYGMIAALVLDATIIRMLLVPSVMRMLGDDCWWAPRWLEVVQRKIGLGETILGEEPDEKVGGAAPSVGHGLPVGVAAATGGAGTAAVLTRRSRPGRRVADGPRMPWRRSDAGFADDAAPVSDERIDVGAPDVEAPTRAMPPGRGAAPTRPAAPAPRQPEPRQTGPRRAEPQRAAPQRSEPRPEPARASTTSVGPRSRSDGPDTGGWSLGDGGIRLGDAPSRPAAPAPAPAPPASHPRPSAGPAPTSEPQGPGPGDRVRTGPQQAAPVRSEPGRRVDQPAPQPRVDQPAPQPRTDPAARMQPPAPRQRPGETSAPPMPQPGVDSPLRRRPALDQTGRQPLAASLSPEGRPRPTGHPGTPGRSAAMDRGLSEGATPAAGTSTPPPYRDTDRDGEQGREPADRQSADRQSADRHARTEGWTDANGQISVQDLLRRSRSQGSRD